jgi:hypothetical protein
MVMHEDEVADIWEDEGVAVEEVVDEVRVSFVDEASESRSTNESQRYSES